MEWSGGRERGGAEVAAGETEWGGGARGERPLGVVAGDGRRPWWGRPMLGRDAGGAKGRAAM